MIDAAVTPVFMATKVTGLFTTFFIMALGYIVIHSTLGRIAGQAWGWAGFWIAVVGTVITTVAILSGTSTVLYTFYPPLLAHPAFYIGATLLVIGSWIWCGVMVASLVSWRRREPGARPRLPVRRPEHERDDQPHGGPRDVRQLPVHVGAVLTARCETSIRRASITKFETMLEPP